MKLVTNTIKKNIKYIILIFVLLGVVIAGQRLLSSTESTDTEQEYITETVERGTIVNAISASGVIETANYLSVKTSVNGIVKEVYVNEGDTVKKGQAIMEITLSSDGEESVASARSSYQSSKNALDSAEKSLITYENNLIKTEEDFEDEKVANSYQTHDERVSYKLAENNYKVAEADYDNQLEVIAQKKTALNKAWLTYQAQSPTIVAPDNGVVANIVVVEGMDVSNSLSERTSISVASIKKEGTPIVSLSVNELDITNVNVGQETNITLTSADRQNFKGSVVGIDKIAETSGGVANYTVIVKFNESYELAYPGMGVDADIMVDEKVDVVYVPASAVSTNQGKSYVTKVNKGGETQVEVELGVSDGKNIEVISGLSECDQILVAVLPTSGFSDNQEQSTQKMPGIKTGVGGMGGQK